MPHRSQGHQLRPFYYERLPGIMKWKICFQGGKQKQIPSYRLHTYRWPRHLYRTKRFRRDQWMVCRSLLSLGCLAAANSHVQGCHTTSLNEALSPHLELSVCFLFLYQQPPPPPQMGEWEGTYYLHLSILSNLVDLHLLCVGQCVV